MAETLLESPRLKKAARHFLPYAQRLLPIFPGLEWKLKRAKLDVSAAEYLAHIFFIPLGIFLAVAVVLAPFFLLFEQVKWWIYILVAVFPSAWVLFYMLVLPMIRIGNRRTEINKDLSFMLRDMQIQLGAGVPLFDVLNNISAGGYGECSKVAQDIVSEIQSGESMSRVLNDYGLLSPSNYMRRALCQIANALEMGSDIRNALEAISEGIQEEKEDKIKSYGQELSLWGLIYMMCVIVVPSMGVALLAILTSFMGNSNIFPQDNPEILLAGIAVFVIFLQFIFISLIRSKRPQI